MELPHLQKQTKHSDNGGHLTSVNQGREGGSDDPKGLAAEFPPDAGHDKIV
jgi:hypothetical protein